MRQPLEETLELVQTGRLDEAEAAFRAHLDMDGSNARAWFEYGNVLAALGRSAKAADAFRAVIALRPDLAAAHFNLGNALFADGDLEGSVEAYRAALERSPDMDQAHVNLGTSLAMLERLEEAAVAFRRAIAANPESESAHFNLGRTLQRLGRLPESLLSAMLGANSLPESARLHFELGRGLEMAGELESAATAFQRMLELDPTSQIGHESLIRALDRDGRPEEAEQAARAWLAQFPEDPRARHQFAAIGHEATPSRAPDGYVKSLFDEFAEKFDETLERLDCHLPDIVAHPVAALAEDTGRGLDVLDLGCGTGLSGVPLRPSAHRLDGVDLSAGMLAKAGERGIYDGLHEAEICHFLETCQGSYDAVTAADVMVYVGDLAPVSAGAAKVLRPGGLFVFSVEDAGEQEESFALTPTGRYRHSEAYVRATLCGAGLGDVEVTPITLRKEQSRPVAGLLVTATAPATP